MNYESPSSKAARSVRALLAEKRESIESLAEATGIAHSTLKRRLLTISPFTIDELSVIAEHFGVRVHDLLTPPSERLAAV
ncbi:helix-turn-helix domain-containing protein [Pseudoclavibacter terrae]|uniref:Helix-turn-helix transcriptional regulator n=1 Tax=Pseudoclavibacter terrae TaxID=1530195 RepID=A0A7J5B6M1_9MICO|nr:helix-turn-helix transcriptional regulator [Pseudoclavibacter terrae]KAB1639838.1 helix-turn-helix transcriptional regulator [Pseudoclavibacter terrae]